MPQGLSQNPTTWRFDRFELAPPFRHRNGSLLFTARVARVGILPYRQDDGSTRLELVPPETLNTPEAVAAYACLPITAPHPKEPVTPKTRRRDGVGTTLQRAKFAGGYIEVECLVDDEAGLARLQRDGWKEVSAGYEVECLEEPGVHPVFGHYDAIQVRRDPNHVSIVPRGRAGETVSANVHFDAAEGFDPGAWARGEAKTPPKFWFYNDAAHDPPNEAEVEHIKETSIMPQVNLDGVTLEVADAATAQAINTWRKDMEGKVESLESEKADMEAKHAADMEGMGELEQKATELQAKISTLEGERDTLQAELDEIKTKLNERTDALTAEEWKARTEQRQRLDAAADFFEVEDAAGKSDDDLKRAILTAAHGELRQDADGNYVDGALEVVLRRVEKRNDSYNLDKPEPPAPKPADRPPKRRRDDEADASASYQSNAMNAWKKQA